MDNEQHGSQSHGGRICMPSAVDIDRQVQMISTCVFGFRRQQLVEQLSRALDLLDLMDRNPHTPVLWESHLYRDELISLLDQCKVAKAFSQGGLDEFCYRLVKLEAATIEVSDTTDVIRGVLDIALHLLPRTIVERHEHQFYAEPTEE